MKKRRKEMNSNRKIARIAGALLIIATVASLLSTGITVSILDARYYQTLGTLLLAVREWANFVFSVSAFSLGALMYYYVLYQSKLIPRWLSGWGLIGAAFSLSAALLMMFGLKPYSIVMIVLILP